MESCGNFCYTRFVRALGGLLDGSVPLDAVTPLLELSYDLAGAAGAKRRTRGGEPE